MQSSSSKYWLVHVSYVFPESLEFMLLIFGIYVVNLRRFRLLVVRSLRTANAVGATWDCIGQAGQVAEMALGFLPAVKRSTDG